MSEDQLRQGSGPKVYLVGGKEVIADDEGFLESLESWSEEVAEILAREQGLAELSEMQWRLLKFVRTYYLAHGRVPLNSHAKKATGMSMEEILACFPGGIRKTARRLAGLPNLRGCL